MIPVTHLSKPWIVEIQAQPKVSESSVLTVGQYLVEIDPQFYYQSTEDEQDQALGDWSEALNAEPGFHGQVTEILVVEPVNYVSYGRVFLVIDVQSVDLPPQSAVPVLIWALVTAISAVAVSAVGVALVLSVSATPDSWRRLGATFLLPITDNETLEEIAAGEFDPGLGEELLDVPRQVATPFAVAAAAVALIFLNRG